MNKSFFIGACSALLLLSGCADQPSSTETSSPSAEFLQYTETQAKAILRTQPTFATSLGLSEDYLGMKFNHLMPDYSVGQIDKTKQLNVQLTSDLAQFDRNLLEGTAATTYDVMATSLARTAEFTDLLYGAYYPLGIFTPFTVTQISGPHIELPRALQTEQPLTNQQEAEDYLSRLEGLRKVFTDTAEVVTLETSHGLTPPRFALEGSINVINRMTEPSPADNPLVTVYANKLADIDSLTAQQRGELVERATQIVAQQVYPGYNTLKTALGTAAQTARTEPGIWAIPNGEHLYELMLETYGAAGKTPEQVHQLGLDEVKRIHREMDAILRAEGLTEGPVMERYIALSEDKQYLYPNTDDGREALIDDLNVLVKTVDHRLPEILKTLPKAPVEVRRIPTYEQDSAPGGYYTSPTLDGSRPGIFWINLKDTADWAKFTLPTLTYHEASPGHHLQIAIAQEIEDMPMLRNMMWYSQYGEGWALYAERLAKEMGLYETDPLGDLGRLQAELFRAGRLVVDTGLHYKRWSRAEAIDWMHKNTGETVPSVTREVERYSVWPGQATSYKLGQIRILELRDMAQKALGDKFVLREFNDEVLIHGSVPLPVLEANIKDWIKRTENI